MRQIYHQRHHLHDQIWQAWLGQEHYRPPFWDHTVYLELWQVLVFVISLSPSLRAYNHGE